MDGPTTVGPGPADRPNTTDHIDPYEYPYASHMDQQKQNEEGRENSITKKKKKKKAKLLSQKQQP